MIKGIEMKIEYPIRLQVFLAKSGVGSRRSCESLIVAGRVKVNNERIVKLGTKVNKEDAVMVDDVPVEPIEKNYYFALNKPKGYVCTNYDPNERLYARELIMINDWDLLFHVGRLDKDSTGLIIYTNDGDIANKIAHPSHEIEKEYLVSCDREVHKRDLELACKGLYIDLKQPYKIKSYQMLTSKWTKVVLTEGKNRELRKIFSYFGYEVKQLCRTRIGNIQLGNLKVGQYRQLSVQEMQKLVGDLPADKASREAN
ncbi:MAG: rRNA pseudouridine synthase [Spirochaetia bacterium]|nr:rRNA pseudouridine synthase [Spirochaetia bacterium]